MCSARVLGATHPVYYPSAFLCFSFPFFFFFLFCPLSWSIFPLFLFAFCVVRCSCFHPVLVVSSLPPLPFSLALFSFHVVFLISSCQLFFLGYVVCVLCYVLCVCLGTFLLYVVFSDPLSERGPAFLIYYYYYYYCFVFSRRCSPMSLIG